MRRERDNSRQPRVKKTDVKLNRGEKSGGEHRARRERKIKISVERKTARNANLPRYLGEKEKTPNVPFSSGERVREKLFPEKERL